MKLSIVTTLFKSAGTINEFYQRTLAAAEPLGYEIELVLVNDGSPDTSLDLAVALHRADSRVTVVDLARNYGHHKALMAGLAHATGDLVFLIDSDLDEEPEVLAALHQRLLQGDCDVVYGFQSRRRGGPIAKLTGELYFWLLDKISDDDIPRNVMTVRLMKRAFVQALLQHRDRVFLISQLWSASGFKQVGVPVNKLSRAKPAYSLGMRVDYFVKHLTTSSTRLLYIIFYLGVVLSILAAAGIIFILLRYVLVGIGVTGFASLIVSIWFFGGLLTLILGIQGIYVANILAESKRRPNTVVRQVYGSDSAEASSSGVFLSSLH